MSEVLSIKYSLDVLIRLIQIIDYCKKNCNYVVKLILQKKKQEQVPENILVYNQKNSMFNTHIDKVLNDVISKKSPQLHEKLISVEVTDKNYKIPAISLMNFCTNDLNSIIDNSLSRKLDNNAIDNQLIDFMTNELKRKVYDKPTYRLIDSSGRLRIGISSYFQTLSTSDIHYINFIRELPLHNETINWDEYLNKNFLTNWQSRVDEILDNNFDSYSASIGCAVLTMIKDKNGEYRFFAKQNSHEKNSGLDGHVSPSFMYQPSSIDYEEQVKEMDLTAQVIREFGEELLNMKKLQAPYLGALEVTLNGHIEKKKDQKLRQLNDLINDKSSKVQLIATGLILDIFRLRPEITFLLLIEDDNFLSDLKIRGNWEAKGKQIELYKVDSYKKFLSRANNVPDLCAPGMAALINGMEYAKKNIFKNGETKK